MAGYHARLFRINETDMVELGIDIETYSGYDLSECGVYKYVEHPDFAVLLFAYSVDNGPVSIIDIANGERIPSDIESALTDPTVTKTAFNASFERICLSRFLGLGGLLPPEQWKCTMVRAARMGLPLSLGQCGEVLRLEDGKMKEGKALIRYFSVPGKNGRRYPSEAPDKWETFKRYCVRDVETEQAILSKVRGLETCEFDEALYVADQEINDRGVLINRTLVENAARFDEEYKAELIEEARKLTGMENPNSPTQIKQWIRERTGLSVESLSKKGLDGLEESLRYWPDASNTPLLISIACSFPS